MFDTKSGAEGHGHDHPISLGHGSTSQIGSEAAVPEMADTWQVPSASFGRKRAVAKLRGTAATDSLNLLDQEADQVSPRQIDRTTDPGFWTDQQKRVGRSPRRRENHVRECAPAPGWGPAETLDDGRLPPIPTCCHGFFVHTQAPVSMLTFSASL
jgi:hypothetical protein